MIKKEGYWKTYYVCSICGEHSSFQYDKCPFCHNSMKNPCHTALPSVLPGSLVNTNGAHLDFPSWEYIKGLPLKDEEYECYKEYTWVLFETGILGVSGVLTWNEDGQKKLIFDVFIGGHSGESGFDKVFNGNKEGHKKMRDYVFNEVYLKILHTLNQDMSWQWE